MGMKKVLLLNAGHTEEPLIKELKELGVYLVTSGNRPDMPGHAYADKYIQADYSDRADILRIVKEENIEGIVSCAHDYGIVTASYVAEKWGGRVMILCKTPCCCMRKISSRNYV